MVRVDTPAIQASELQMRRGCAMKAMRQPCRSRT